MVFPLANFGTYKVLYIVILFDIISLSMIVLNSGDQHKKYDIPLLHASIICDTLPEKPTEMHW